MPNTIGKKIQLQQETCVTAVKGHRNMAKRQEVQIEDTAIGGKDSVMPLCCPTYQEFYYHYNARVP